MKTKKIISICISFMLAIAVVFSGIATTAEAAVSSPKSAKSGKYIYYANGNKICRLNTETKAYKTMKAFSSDVGVVDIDVKDGWIYFETQTLVDEFEVEFAICRMRTSGSDYKKIASDATKPVIYGSKIYYLKCTCDEETLGARSIGIYKMNLTGSSKSLVKKSSKIDEIKVYKDRIYYVYRDYDYDDETASLRSIKLDGSNLKTHTKGDKINKIIPYSGYVYYNKGNNIYRLNTTSLKNSLHKSKAILLAKDKAGTYYVDRTNSSLYRKTSSSTITVMKRTDERSPYEVHAFGDFILVNAFDSSMNLKTYYCTKNGKNRKTIGTYSFF